MNIKILDSWLRDYLKTQATPQQIAEKLSLSSVSVEKIEKFKNDLVYDIEVTTNRPELMSLVGLARETAAVLNQNDIHATLVTPNLPNPPDHPDHPVPIVIKNNPKLINRLCAVIMDVTIKQSPQQIKDRLESTDIRSLNNVIDITNYVMRVIGHPTHIFDYDRLSGQKLIIRESKQGEKIVTLDQKEYTLPGADIIAEDGEGNIVDLPGIMGLQNSVITDNTKRVLFFINNDEPTHIRKTSMALGIRTEAAVLNEKGIDPELAMDALLYGISLFQELADAKVISNIIDIYPNKVRTKTVTVSEDQINKVIGVNIPLKKSQEILKSLGFTVEISSSSTLTVTPPSIRAQDIEIPEDVIEEIARVYGYHNIPNTLPAATVGVQHFEPLQNNELYWEDRIKDALKYWGFTEVYTYPMVSEELYEGPIDNAVTIQNPLSEEFTYMRCTLVPSLLKIVRENPGRDSIKIFEIANVYIKKPNDLPEQKTKLAAVIKKPNISFYEIKGIVEQLLSDLGITNVSWKPLDNGGQGATVYSSSDPELDEGESRSDGSRLRSNTNAKLADIEILDDNLINFEFDFQQLSKHATLKKKYQPASKYPPVVEDLALIAPESVTIEEIRELISKQSSLIREVSLLDKYKETRTFHIIYQSYQKNLTNEEVGEIRTKILKVLKEKLNTRLKE